MNNENSCSDFIKLILKRGGRWRNKQIENAILETYGVPFQNNTIAKYLSFMINDGKVLSAPVKDKKESVCFEYWWIDNDKKMEKLPLVEIGLMCKCREVAKTYPDDHPELKKIMLQIERLEARDCRT